MTSDPNLEELGPIAGTLLAVKRGTLQVVELLLKLDATAEAERRAARRFRWAQVVANLVLVILVLFTLSTFVQSVSRSRDRQQCVFELQANYNTRFAETIQAAAAHPGDRAALAPSIVELGKANDLLHQASALCYGGEPNPRPVP